jgi:hypothetical protein
MPGPVPSSKTVVCNVTATTWPAHCDGEVDRRLCERLSRHCGPIGPLIGREQ